MTDQSAPPVGQRGAVPTRAVPVRTYRGRAIAALVLSPLLGIFALSQSLQVGQRLRRGDVAGARRASRAARTLSTVVFCIVGVAVAWTMISAATGSP